MQVAVWVILLNFNLDFFPHKNDISNDGEGDTHLHTGGLGSTWLPRRSANRHNYLFLSVRKRT